MFISNAFAAEGGQGGGDMSMIIVLTVCMLAVYFFVMRPNSKKRKEMQMLLQNLAVGDEVLTNGGIAGKITKLPDNKEYILIAICEGITMQIKRNYVVAVLPKGTLAETADPALNAKGTGSRRNSRRGRPSRRKEEALEQQSSETPALDLKSQEAEALEAQQGNDASLDNPKTPETSDNKEQAAQENPQALAESQDKKDSDGK